MSERDPSPSIRDSSLEGPYLTLVNLSRSSGQPDDWRVALVEPAEMSEPRPVIGRAFWFAVLLSGALWGALYGFWRLCEG